MVRHWSLRETDPEPGRPPDPCPQDLASDPFQRHPSDTDYVDDDAISLHLTELVRSELRAPQVSNAILIYNRIEWLIANDGFEGISKTV